jgi:hypothetical protein
MLGRGPLTLGATDDQKVVLIAQVRQVDSALALREGRREPVLVDPADLEASTGLEQVLDGFIDDRALLRRGHVEGLVQEAEQLMGALEGDLWIGQGDVSGHGNEV